MATEEVCLGTWKIVECVSLAGSVETTGIEGTEFILDEGGDISWKVSEDAETLPFFNCETYEIVPDKTLAPKAIKFIGTYAGLEVNFKVEVSDDLMLLTYERCCMLQCQKVSSPDPRDDIPFSFLGALEEGYFSDIVITADTGKEFKVHTTILCLTTPAIDWSKSPTPFTGLPEDVLQTTLHYMYAECLPRGLSEDTALKCVKIMSKIPELVHFVKLCDTFLKNTALKQQITSLVTDMHASADKITEMLSNEDTLGLESSIISNPAKLCYVVKQSIREAAVAVSKLLILCDLFSRRKSELSREERHDIIKYAKSRIPVFMKQWEHFLDVCKTHTSKLSASQRQEIATYLVPEIEMSLDYITNFISGGKAALEQIIDSSESEKTEKTDKGKKGHVTDVLGKTLKNALHVRELKKLKKLYDRSSTSVFHIMQKKESFIMMSQVEKERAISKLLEQLVDTIHLGQMKIQDLIEDIDVRLTWRDWKYIFKLGTSKISWAICKLLSNKMMIQPLIKEACDMVHREQFTASVTSLNLLDTTGAENSSPPFQSPTQPQSSTSSSKTIPNKQKSSSASTSSSQAPQKTKYIQLSSVESLCISPYARDSRTAQKAVQLLDSSKHTDLVFEIIIAHDNGDTVIDHTVDGEPVVRTDTDRDVDIYQIPAHRVVIAARCDWFRRALLSGMRESIDRKITVHDTHPELFKSFLEYLYCGQLDTNDMATEQLADMMTLADRYDTISLRSRCEHALKHLLDEDTVFYLLSLADQLTAKVLKDACKSYISEHPELTSTEVFQDLPEHLQMEVETLTLDCHPRHSIHSHTETPSSMSSMSEMDEMMNNVDIMDRMNIESGGTSSSSEDMLVCPDSSQVTLCVETIQDIVGDTIPHDELVRAALAADCDANRALNFLFA